MATAGWPAQAAKCHSLPAWLHYKGGWHTARMWGHGCAPCWACWPACHPTGGHHRAQLAGVHTLCHSALAQGSSHNGGGSQPSNSGASWAQAHGLAPQNLGVGRQPKQQCVVLMRHPQLGKIKRIKIHIIRSESKGLASSAV